MAKAKKAGASAEKGGAGSIGLTVAETRDVDSGSVRDLTAAVEDDGGAVLGSYRDPFGGTPVLVVSLPINKVEPTPYQRDPSETHIKKLMTVIEKVGRFLDPLVLIRQDDGYWTPNGNHRLQAMKKLGAKSIIALARAGPGSRLQDPRAQHREGAQRQREVARDHPHGARAGGAQGQGKETDFAFEFEQAQFLTLGAAYEQKQEPERRRLHVGASADRRLPRRADGQGAEGTRAPRQQGARAR